MKGELFKIEGLKHYKGSKDSAGTMQTIINLIPPHTKYYELFVGKGVILRHIKPASITVANDIDPKVIKLWRKSSPKDIIIHNYDARQILISLEDNDRNTFVYLDPPYPINSRKQNKQLYNYEMTDDDHIKLLSLIVKANYNCMISSYPNPIYKELLSGWYKHEYKSMNWGGKSTELLYMNYPPPTELHDYRFLGNDFQDRSRIRQKIQRWSKILNNLPILEQKAIMYELNKNSPNPHCQ